jgi:uncharacterized protein (DUF2336 family)
VTDLFLVDAEPTAAAKDHYAEIADQSLGRLRAADRATYANRVAAAPSLPQATARKLAGDDDVAVASVVLRLSPVLTDADLASIAVTHSQSHLVAIAERATLSETVTEVLVERGDEIVLRKVSGNEGAQFSGNGLSRLVERGQADPVVSANLVRRAERLPPEQAKRVLQIATQVGPQTASPGVAGVAAQPLAKQARERRLEVKLLIADIRDGKSSIDEVVAVLCEQDRAFDLAQVISTFADIPNAQVLKALLQPDASAVGVACKSLDLDPKAFRAILQLRASRLRLSARQVDRDAQLYEQLPADTSQRAMRFLKVRSRV